MNEKNLKPGAHKLTVEELSRGGKNSAAQRSFKAAFKKRIRDSPGLLDALIDALIEAVGNGNMAALKLAVELLGENESDLDKKLKKAQIEKIKAETEDIRRRNDDGGGVSVEERAALADVLRRSAEAIWKDGDDEN